MAKFTVDVYADTVCPWCYIGKKSLDAAIAQHRASFPEDDFEINWRPYILFPNAKVSAYHKKDSFTLKFGPSAPAVLARMDAAAAPYNIHLTWEGRTGSSRDSHKLILLSSSSSSSSSPQKVQSEFIDALFQGNQTQGKDISDRKGFLIPTALEHGLADDEETLLQYLDSEEADRRVDEEAARARRDVGVAAVPSYVVNGRYRVGGMQEPGVFTGLFERIRGGGGK
ncbi:thioredoxin-like protein [Echria macrotheca]|uniref:Thioredoxin-like protein n=1 Tax=Echria macrotheca TaxID=438768 RepID=A0AAJ0BCX0_9PEZI|nr:thioredoxin-like protein [Echria macrotheca]